MKLRWARRKEKLKALGYPCWKVPFDKEGNQVHYADSLMDHSNGKLILKEGDYTWKDNFRFDDTLELMGFVRGKKQPHFLFRSITTDKKYWMFFGEFFKMCQLYAFKKGRVKTTWTFTKNGQNYGIKPLLNKVYKNKKGEILNHE